MKKVLIIKLGYSETLASFLNLGSSLGDVLRTTFILHYFKNCDVSWLVDYKALPLLENNPYIKRILIYNPDTVSEVKKEFFDIVINFEKIPQICAMANSIKAKKYFGFRFDENNKENSFWGDRNLVEISQNIENKRKNKYFWQEILARSIGENWYGEGYILGYKPKSKVKYDIGFNWTTSNKWKNKAWPKEYWQRLEELVKDNYSISWQQGLKNLYEYMEWINSCRLIVTADTLGLHLALALKKRVVALFGPTSPYEIYFYNLGSFLLPDSPYQCLPCFELICDKEKPCIEYIESEKVKKSIENEFEKIISSRKL